MISLYWQPAMKPQIPFALAWLAAILLVSPMATAQSADNGSIRLVDVTASSKITFRHHDGGSGKGYIVEGVTGGLATFDYDNDGLIDIYLLSGAPLKGATIDPPPRAALYRNNGDWTFTDVTDEAGVGNRGHGMGVVAGDYDNDGDQDLYVSNFGPNVLYRNNGDGTFTDVTAEAGVSRGHKVGAGVSFFDMDGDGDLDLYVGNYVDFTYENHVPIVVKGQPFKAGPKYYKPVADILFRNNGNGSFTDVSEISGIGAVAGPSMATLCFDYDDDGDSDVFVANDEQPNFLFQNDGAGKFKEVAVLAGVAYDFHGKANSNMGVDCADYDNDGKLDLFTTDYQSEMPVLYRNLGRGHFAEATSAARIPGDLFAHVHWGTGFVDFDNDGDRDLFVACGHFDKIELIDDRTAYKVRNYLLENTGDGKFRDVSKQSGSGLAVVESSRGAAFDDLDNDGDIDVVVLNSNAPPTILRNESQTPNRWLQVRLQGQRHNADGVGARVKVFAGSRTQVAEVIAGRSYQGHCGTRLHFGLGKQERVDKVEVRWQGGVVETRTDIAAGRVQLLKEGETGQHRSPR